ncbi:MAG: hypothetical protein GWO20_09905, partial [Candidatus Korarchaeota archaeon]|nr:hypothetical protein [Candidatus Korarchaeota archaeon]NIU85524.1 hypothetical protein [Candidatus Thorarchaeota archaeon]NIW13977.1 hypothetical protein [Candidatus Thorarchaeota archaeon]NIW52114.1 hypothetical protein [Candidatus Korarchaeota archaeon]
WFGYNVKFRVTIKARKTWLSEPTYIEVDDAKVHIDYKQVRDDGWTKTGSMSDVTDSDGEVIFNFYFDWDIDMDY